MISTHKSILFVCFVTVVFLFLFFGGGEVVFVFFFCLFVNLIFKIRCL